MQECQEVAGRLVVTRGDSPALLELPKEPFNLVPLTVQRLVIRAWHLVVLSRGDDHLAPLAFRELDHPSAIVPLVRDHMLGLHSLQRGTACVMSFDCPGVSVNFTGFPSPSQSAWIFVPCPPRERPSF